MKPEGSDDPVRTRTFVSPVGELRTGREITFAIPYRLEGTVWFDGGSIGRLAVGYGPVEGVWALPAQGAATRD
jgi:hypothetical protein